MMPLGSHTGHEMHHRGLTGLACKSRPGHLFSNAWCLWNVHVDKKWISVFVTISQFPKVQSHALIYIYIYLYLFICAAKYQ